MLSNSLSKPQIAMLNQTKEYEIVLYGAPFSKKNRYMPRKDKPGFFKGSRLEDQINRMSLQITGEMRDLKLRHPDVTVEMHSPHGRFDRDNFLTALLDILVNMGVIVDDNVSNFNGTMTVLPCVSEDEPYVRIVLRENLANGWKPYNYKPKRVKIDSTGQQRTIAP